MFFKFKIQLDVFKALVRLFSLMGYGENIFLVLGCFKRQKTSVLSHGGV